MSRDDQLARAVIVGGNHQTVIGANLAAHLFNDLVGKSDDGCHRAGCSLAALLHSHSTSMNQTQAVLEGQRSGSHECRQLAQRVTSHHSGLEVVAHADSCYHAMQEHGRLCHLRLLQLFCRTIEHDVGDSEAKYFVSLVEEFASLFVLLIQILAHSNKLGALSGEYKCFHFSFLFLF